MIKLPNSAFDLQITLVGLENRIEELEPAFEEIKSELIALHGADAAKFKENAANFHGIGLLDLINSPNYSILMNEYKDTIWNLIHTKIMKKLNLKEKEAWALLCAGLGLMDVSS